MKSQIRLYREELADFYEWLPENVETNTEQVDWRVLMFRKKDQPQWTQVYDGLTQRAKTERAFFRVFGPDSGLVTEFYNKDVPQEAKS